MVACHLSKTCFVAIYSLRLAYKYDVDTGEVLERAIVHDMEEVITGDIPTPTKYANEQIKTAIKSLEEEAAVRISQEYFYGCMDTPWSKAKDIRDDPGTVVYIADMAAVVYKIWVERALGNKDFMKYTENIYGRLVQAQGFIKTKFLPELYELIKMVEEIQNEST